MPTNESEHDPGIIPESHPAGSRASSPLIASVPAANGQDVQNDHTINPDALPPPPPPLGVKLTAYRLLNMSVVLSFGFAKGILTYMGQSIAPTTLDWVAGALLTTALYWIGLYESIDAKAWEWFFHVDLAHSIGYSAKRFIGGVVGVLFALHGTLTITALSTLPVFLLAHFVSHVSRDIWLAVYICLTSCVHFFWLRTRRLRAGARARKYATDFLEAYGLGASLAERHEWLGSLGAILGFFCGMVLVWSPLGILYLTLSRESEALTKKLGYWDPTYQ